jgi:hypothetical protein
MRVYFIWYGSSHGQFGDYSSHKQTNRQANKRGVEPWLLSKKYIIIIINLKIKIKNNNIIIIITADIIFIEKYGGGREGMRDQSDKLASSFLNSIISHEIVAMSSISRQFCDYFARISRLSHRKCHELF